MGSMFGPSDGEKALMKEQRMEVDRQKRLAEREQVTSMQDLLGAKTDAYLRQFGRSGGSMTGAFNVAGGR